MKEYSVYILRCSDGSYYTGVTSLLEKRVAEHQQGVLKKSYTFSRCPVECVFVEHFSTPLEAIALEKQIKGWSRKKKEALIRKDWEALRRLSRPHGSTGSP